MERSPILMLFRSDALVDPKPTFSYLVLSWYDAGTTSKKLTMYILAFSGMVENSNMRHAEVKAWNLPV